MSDTSAYLESHLSKANDIVVILGLECSAMSNSAAELAEVQDGLSERETAILEFEKTWWQSKASKEMEIRDRFDMSVTRYYQVLNSLIDREDALKHDPLLVKRLRRLREQRQRERSAARLATR